MKGIESQGSAPEILHQALNQAVSRGTLLCWKPERDGEVHELYFVNTDADRRAVEKIKSGELKVGNLVKGEPCPVSQEQPNIFTLYEKNIGMLTPIIAEEIERGREAISRFLDSGRL